MSCITPPFDIIIVSFQSPLLKASQRFQFLSNTNRYLSPIANILEFRVPDRVRILTKVELADKSNA